MPYTGKQGCRESTDFQAVIPNLSGHIERSPRAERESSLGCEAGPSAEEAMADLLSSPGQIVDDSSDEVSLPTVLSHRHLSLFRSLACAWVILKLSAEDFETADM